MFGIVELCITRTHTSLWLQEIDFRWNEYGFKWKEAGFEWKESGFTREVGIMRTWCTIIAGVLIYYGMSTITIYMLGSLWRISFCPHWCSSLQNNQPALGYICGALGDSGSSHCQYCPYYVNYRQFSTHLAFSRPVFMTPIATHP